LKNSSLITQIYSIQEEELINLLKRKERRGIEYLYDRYSSSLYGVVLRIVKSEILAEEVLQDVFIKIWEKIDLYDPQKGRLYTWMINLTRNQALDKLKSKEFKRVTKTSEIKDTDAGSLESIDPDTIGLKEIVEKLSPEQKQVIDLMYFEGYTQSEIAEKFGIPLGTIKTRVRAAINKLRSLF
jgi:RNA polymerase sigma-70 factor (ECF subfamily)